LINNRQQSGRRRGRGNNNQRSQGGNSGGNRNQDNGNRIDNRSRGNAAQLLEKYKTLARDAQQSGDRVLTEYYLQFADHYFRVLADTRARYEEQNPRREERGDRYEANFDGEEGVEGEELDEFDARPQSGVQAPQPPARYDREPREAREPRDDREPRGDREESRPPRRERNDYNDRPRGNGSDRGNDRNQDRGPREDRARDDRPRFPRERRPERDADEGASTLSLDMLPPAIAVSAPEEVAEAPAPKPRRPRAKKVTDEVAAEG
jgi:Domain of unknown function (DUF4167)